MSLKYFISVFGVLLVVSFVENNGEILNNEHDLQNEKDSLSEEENITDGFFIYPKIHFEDTPVSSEEFPPDIFTIEQLRQGAALLHFVGALYSFGVIGIVCGDYFLPSIDCICYDLNLSQDVAAATFMSFATTAPELFIILIATFITKSDIGVGAVIGSGMFNILGVATIGGLAAISPIKLDWWPLYRDSLVYMMAPIALAIVVADGQVTLMESIALIVYYFLYFIVMFFNRSIRIKIKKLVKEIKSGVKVQKDKPGSEKPVEKPKTKRVPTISLTLDDSKVTNTQIISEEILVNRESEEIDYDGSFKAYFVNYEDSRSLRRISACSTCSNKSNRSRRKSDKSLNLRNSIIPTGSSPNHLQVSDNINLAVPQISDMVQDKKIEDSKKNIDPHVCDSNAEEILSSNLFTFPKGSLWDKFMWLIQWPASFVLYYTIPDCRFERWRKYYPLTFIMCIFWIGIASYFGTWMISVIGDTLKISDSVMGLTFLALGGSMPEAISTFIMARQGEGGLGFSNSLGGNTMDICLCLGLPWMVNCLIYGPVLIESEGLMYNTVALVIGIVVLLSVVTHTKFHMNKKLGIVCCTFYIVYIIISVLIELNVINVDS